MSGGGKFVLTNVNDCTLERLLSTVDLFASRERISGAGSNDSLGLGLRQLSNDGLITSQALTAERVIVMPAPYPSPDSAPGMQRGFPGPDSDIIALTDLKI